MIMLLPSSGSLSLTRAISIPFVNERTAGEFLLSMKAEPEAFASATRQQGRGDVSILSSLPLPELAELGLSIACSMVSLSYITHKEQSGQATVVRELFTSFLRWLALIRWPQAQKSPLLQRNAISNLIPEVLGEPSSALMLASYLVLGCAVSSFLHRRNGKDGQQATVFMLFAVSAATIGRALGASANMITLGLVPWALCTAMTCSFVGHSVGRFVNARHAVAVGEKEAVLSKEDVKQTFEAW
jgi:hypothetical protein